MTKRMSAAFITVALIIASISCQKKAQVKGIDLVVGFAEKNLSDNLMTQVQYKWKINADFQKFDTDYTVYVHFWDKNNLLFQDDHVPTLATSQWAPGKECTYVRTIYIPKFIDEFDPEFKGQKTLRMVVGLYNPFDRSGKSRTDVFEKKLTVVPSPPDAPEIVYESGWYDLETNPDAFLKQWRWMGKSAVCIIDNPKRDAVLVIKGGSNVDAVKDQKLTLKINDFVLDEFVLSESSFAKNYNVKKEILGDKEQYRLTLEVDKTFVPSKLDPKSKDDRELGAQISFIYFR